jgi:Glu-tRNA(Gln) amidotransferase subunit E-like FAD-binding protein
LNITTYLTKLYAVPKTTIYLNNILTNKDMQINYQGLGFKCGLEIHQQLEGKKLFCNCPTLNLDEDPDVRFERRLRAVAGETGQIDVAAQHEMIKNKKFIYEASSKDTCLVEYDEEPPYNINPDALKTAFKVALLLNAKPIYDIRVMRKTVVDGSNVSGFQRTALIATDGKIPTSNGEIGIPTICIEEEAAQRIEDKDNHVKFKLDRLGIPLIEIATDSSIKNNEHAKEAAYYIGMVLRSVEGIKRGLGTIRQDVNVSIAKGARTEIKGFQDLRSIPKVIDNEINRQLNQLKSKKNLKQEVRKAEKDFTTTFLRPMPGAARLYPETDVASIITDKKYIKRIESELPKLLADRSEEFARKHNLPKDLAKELLGNQIFDKFVKKFNKIKPQLIAHILVNIPKEIKTRFKEDITKLNNEHFEEVLDYLDSGKVSKEAVIELLIKKLKGEKINLDKFAKVSEELLEKEIKNLVESKKGLNIGAYMGILMGKFRGKVDGKKIMSILKNYIK